MKIVPLRNKVVIQPVQAPETSAGGIVLPEATRNDYQPAEGRIVSVGSGRLLADGSEVDLQVNEGDRVLYSGYAGTEVNCDGEELLIVDESDILAVLS